MGRPRPSARASSSRNNKQPSPRGKSPAAHRYFVESLEERRLFVVLHGGDVFEFFANNSFYERVVVTGNTTVELIGGRENPNVGGMQGFSLTQMQGVITAGPDTMVVNGGFVNAMPPGGMNMQPAFVDTIYAMYVSQSDINSSISIAAVPDLMAGGPRPMMPYAGSIGQLRVQPTAVSGVNPPFQVTIPDGSGQALLGARTVNPPMIMNDDNIPFSVATPAGTFTTNPSLSVGPGLYVAAGHDLGTFLFGGTITGNVSIPSGSVQQFYAGALLTGTAAGEADVNMVSNPRNFLVGGDLRDLIVGTVVGTESDARGIRPDYVTGFDMQVGGTIGEFKAGGDIIGNVVALHSPTAPSLAGTPELEVETRGPATFDPWDAGILGTPAGGANQPAIVNDTFANPQYLGTTDGANNIVVSGIIQADAPTMDFTDYYAVPLIAGQTVTVQLTETGAPAPGSAGATQLAAVGNLDVAVFDPETRMVASDYNRVDPSQTEEQPFQFTATEPGVYRFAVAETPNINFDASGGPIRNLMDLPYALLLQNVGNLAIGGIVAGGNILDNADGTSNQPLPGIHAVVGDIGAISAGGSVLSNAEGLQGLVGNQFEFGPLGNVYSIAVDSGNLRDVDGGTIGTISAGVITGDPTDFVPHGSVGLLRATGTILAWNYFIPAGNATLSHQTSAQVAVGGDYQMIDASNGTFGGDLVADGNIGTIRATDMATTLPSYLQVNASYNLNERATIDLIDIRTQLGTPEGGGPAIITGPGGDLRYIHLGYQGILFRDAAFGGGSPEPTLFQNGETATITDDSGSQINLTPVAEGNTATPAATLPFLSVLTYPVRGSGGSAIVNVTSSGGLAIGGTGGSPGQTAEIGTIELDGTGTPVSLATPSTGGAGGSGTGGSGTGTGGTGGGSGSGNGGGAVNNGGGGTGVTTGGGSGTGTFPGAGQPGGPPTRTTKLPYQTLPTPVIPGLPAGARTLGLSYTGFVKVDTFEIKGKELPPPNDGSLMPGVSQVTSIVNDTGGEIVNIHLNSLGALTMTGALGIPEHHTPAAVLGLVHNPLMEDLSHSPLEEPWNFPFYRPTNLIRVLGNIGSITAAGGIGNVYAGFIVMASPPPVTNPIPPSTPPTIALPTLSAASVDGNVGPITGPILGAIATAGSVSSVTATTGFGGFGTGDVGGAGVYSVGVIGPVVSNGDDRGALISFSGQNGLTVNGSMIGAIVANLERFDFSEDRAIGIHGITGIVSPVSFPTLDLGSITVNGANGIIGTDIEGDHIGPIAVSNNGFGIFDSSLRTLGDGTISSITTGGYGIRSSIFNGGATFGPIVANGNGSLVPTSNFTASVRQSDNGIMFDPFSGIPISFLNDLDLYMVAQRPPHEVNGVTDTGVIEDSIFVGSRDLTSVNAWSIRGRNLNQGLTSPDPNYHPVFTVQASTFNFGDRIGQVTVRGPVNGFNVITGRTSKFAFGGDVAFLNMTVAGPIGNLVFNHSLLSDSFINANGPNGKIASIVVHGSLDGGIRATRQIGRVTIDGSLVGNISAASLGTLKLGGGVGSGSLTINSSVGTIQTAGDFGTTGSQLVIYGTLGRLLVGGNMNGSLTVARNLNNLTVKGSVLTGTSVSVGGILRLLKVGGDVQAGATIHAQILKKQIVKGRTLGTIVSP